MYAEPNHPNAYRKEPNAYNIAYPPTNAYNIAYPPTNAYNIAYPSEPNSQNVNPLNKLTTIGSSATRSAQAEELLSYILYTSPNSTIPLARVLEWFETFVWKAYIYKSKSYTWYTPKLVAEEFTLLQTLIKLLNTEINITTLPYETSEINNSIDALYAILDTPNAKKCVEHTIKYFSTMYPATKINYRLMVQHGVFGGDSLPPPTSTSRGGARGWFYLFSILNSIGNNRLTGGRRTKKAKKAKKARARRHSRKN
jgi:hypothetical protein